MPVNTVIDELHDALGLGLGTVTRNWDYKAKDWVTSIFAADITNDGEVEVVACSRDGRVQLLSAKGGDCWWQRVVGEKALGRYRLCDSPDLCESRETNRHSYRLGRPLCVCIGLYNWQAALEVSDRRVGADSVFL